MSQCPHAGFSGVHGARSTSSGEHVSAAQLPRTACSISVKVLVTMPTSLFYVTGAHGR